MPGANFSRIFEIRDPDLPIRYTSFMALRLRQMGLFAKRVYGPVLKITQRSAHAQKSRQRSTLPDIFYHHRSRRPRFPVNRFKFWQTDSI